MPALPWDLTTFCPLNALKAYHCYSYRREPLCAPAGESASERWSRRTYRAATPTWDLRGDEAVAGQCPPGEEDERVRFSFRGRRV